MVETMMDSTTQAAYLLQAISNRLERDIPELQGNIKFRYYDDWASAEKLNGPYCNLLYLSENVSIDTNQIGGLTVVSPKIAVSCYFPTEADDTLNDHNTLLGRASDVRISVTQLIFDHAQGIDAIPNVGSLWITSISTDMAVIDTQTDKKLEVISSEFDFKLSRDWNQR